MIQANGRIGCGHPKGRRMAGARALGLAALLLCAAAGSLAAPLPGSTVFVEDMGNFDELVRAEILRQRLPLDLVAEQGSARYVMRGSASGNEAAMSGALEIIEAASGKIIWAASASRQAGPWRWSGTAPPKTAKRIVEQLAKAVRTAR